MLSPFVRSIVLALLPAGLTLAITADRVHAQQKGPAPPQHGIAGQRAVPNGTIQTRQGASKQGIARDKRPPRC